MGNVINDKPNVIEHKSCAFLMVAVKVFFNIFYFMAFPLIH